MICAIYARVSTLDQHCQMQLTELGEFAERNKWKVSKYVEQESTRKRRPELERLMADAAHRVFDIVLVWKLDRFGRSVQELADNIEALDRAGVRFIVPSQSIDTDQRNPTARLLMHMLAAIAEFERDLIRERVSAGVAAYRKAYAAGQVGKTRDSRSGKNLAPHRPRKAIRIDRATALRKQGMSWRRIAEELGEDQSTIRRRVKGVSKASKTPAKRAKQTKDF